MDVGSGLPADYSPHGCDSQGGQRAVRYLSERHVPSYGIMLHGKPNTTPSGLDVSTHFIVSIRRRLAGEEPIYSTNGPVP